METLPEYIIDAAVQALGYEKGMDITPFISKLATMSKREIFGLYCQWHGLLGGWAGTLTDVVEHIWGVTLG